MLNHKSIIAIDAGNTSVKVAEYVDNSILNVTRYSTESLSDLTSELLLNNDRKVIYSSVLDDYSTKEILKSVPDAVQINSTCKLPFQMNYETPETLGVDRLCNAMCVYNQLSTEYGICVDIGTCIKFDVIHKSKGYMGGSISPGIELRFRSLNEFTGNLPLVSNKTPQELVGISTETSIRSGVMNGMKAEIQGVMSAYESQYESLTFFVTGGDAAYFDIHSKNDIFADENLTLKGLIEIYLYNA